MPYPDLQVLINPYENISSADMSSVSNLALQSIKTLISNVVCQSSYIINGLGFTFTGPSSPTVTVAAGLCFFNISPDPAAYSGAVFYLPSPGTTFSISPPVSGTRTDAIDISYSELQGAGGVVGATALRDQIGIGGVITPNVSMYTQMVSSYTMNYIVGAGAVASGFVRLGTFVVSSTGAVTSPSQITRMWENQTFPGTPNTANQSLTLADNLSSIRSQLNSIIGVGNWYSVIPNSLVALENNIISLNAKLTRGVNLFRNASMGLGNRGLANIPISAGTSGYTLDGWIVGCSTNPVYVNQESGGGNGFGTALYVVKQGASNPTDVFIKQRIESIVVGQLNVDTFVTVQAIIGKYTGTPTLTVNTPTLQDNYTSVTTLVSAVPLQPCSSLNPTNLVSYTFELTTGFYNGLEIIFDFPSPGAQIIFQSPDICSTPSLTTVGLQSNTPIASIRTSVEETSFNERYAYLIGSTSGAGGGTGFGTSTTQGFFEVTIPSMRATPSLTSSFSGSAYVQKSGGPLYTPSASLDYLVSSASIAFGNKGSIVLLVTFSSTPTTSSGSVTQGEPCVFSVHFDSILFTSEI